MAGRPAYRTASGDHGGGNADCFRVGASDFLEGAPTDSRAGGETLHPGFSDNGRGGEPTRSGFIDSVGGGEPLQPGLSDNGRGGEPLLDPFTDCGRLGEPLRPCFSNSRGGIDFSDFNLPARERLSSSSSGCLAMGDTDQTEWEGDAVEETNLGFQADPSPVASPACTDSIRGRGRGRGRGRLSGSSAARSASRPAVKGKNFHHEEEIQLTRSVLAISQDPIVGNQQKGFSFWDRIFDHFKRQRPETDRTARSLDSKWGQMKHDIGEFIGCYKQVTSTKPTGTAALDILQLAKQLYAVKNAKGSEFTYEHCWVLVRDFPRWADGWGSMKQVTPSKRRASPSVVDSGDRGQDFQHVPEGNAEDGNSVLRERPIGVKAAKMVQKGDRGGEAAALKQNAVTEALVEATIAKNAILAYGNVLLLMTTPDSQISGDAAKRFISMCKEDELEKYELHREENRRVQVAAAAARQEARLHEDLVRAAEVNRLAEERAETRRQINRHAADRRAAALASEEERRSDLHSPSTEEEPAFCEQPGWGGRNLGEGTDDDLIREATFQGSEADWGGTPPRARPAQTGGAAVGNRGGFGRRGSGRGSLGGRRGGISSGGGLNHQHFLQMSTMHSTLGSERGQSGGRDRVVVGASNDVDVEEVVYAGSEEQGGFELRVPAVPMTPSAIGGEDIVNAGEEDAHIRAVNLESDFQLHYSPTPANSHRQPTHMPGYRCDYGSGGFYSGR